MPQQTVLDVGNCSPDHASIKRFLTQHFDVNVLQAHGPSDTLTTLRSRSVDLVLINRKLDQDYTDGIEILKLIKSDAELASIPVMIITNYEEHQTAAMALGAVRGFGKLEYQLPETRQRLAAILN